MLLIPCPWCGRREESEFVCGGEAGAPRPGDPDAIEDTAWTAWLWGRRNVKGRVRETWWHRAGCGRWFLVERDTRDDRILASRPIAPPEHPSSERSTEAVGPRPSGDGR
ncbi:MAG: sarcosine oxidase subunit delta [Geminicoccaceae bacterium]|nr:sarcosine oxidase subunit delta [Geminicoccaceae bacterium]MDW8369592.1 sarcosine oxidase subunit delta [Geminicoccaceae bacterium]